MKQIQIIDLKQFIIVVLVISNKTFIIYISI